MPPTNKIRNLLPREYINLLKTLSPSTAGRLIAIGRRLDPIDLENWIFDLCQEREWKLIELGTVLNRSPVYLQNTAIKSLLHQKRLFFVYPDEPNHPRQSYRAAALPAPPHAESFIPSLPPEPSVDPEVLIGVND